MTAPNKVFVTGIYASGKSTFVNKYRQSHELPYLSFDAIYGYAARGERMDLVYTSMEMLGSFIMDALPMSNLLSDWDAFSAFVKDHNCTIIIVKCDIDTWYTKHLPSKASFGDATEVQHKQWFSEFYDGLGAKLESNFPDNVLIYHSGPGYIDPTHPSLRKAFSIMLETLRDRFNTVTYDKNYQNIDILGIVGYDNSAPTWSKITSFPITWNGATVIDLGCFHGYFSIRAKEAGASRVIGLEQSR